MKRFLVASAALLALGGCSPAQVSDIPSVCIQALNEADRLILANADFIQTLPDSSVSDIERLGAAYKTTDYPSLSAQCRERAK